MTNTIPTQCRGVEKGGQGGGRPPPARMCTHTRYSHTHIMICPHPGERESGEWGLEVALLLKSGRAIVS